MIAQKMTIAGCGTLGSSLAYLLSLKSLDGHNIEQINLIDNDCLDQKNIPYLNITSTKTTYIGKPKVYILKDFLKKINSKINFVPYYSTYGGVKSKVFDEDVFVIDCRDTGEVLKGIHLKLNLDGPYGIIKFNPTEKTSRKNSRYTYGNSRYNGFLFASQVIQLICTDDMENRSFAINLEKNGERYEFTGDKPKKV